MVDDVNECPSAERVDRSAVPGLQGSEGQVCDEYPFQSTAQGAASGTIKINWDLRTVDADHNRKVGSMLSILYASERFWYGDHFYVQFTP